MFVELAQILVPAYDAGIMRTALLLFAVLFCLAEAKAADSIFIGRALNNQGIEGVDWVCSDKKDTICLGGWSSMDIEVERMLSGPPVPRHLYVATVLTDLFTPRGLKGFKVFVVKKIEDKNKIFLLRTDYLLKAFVRKGGQVCLEENPASAGFAEYSIFETKIGDETAYCFIVKDR